MKMNARLRSIFIQPIATKLSRVVPTPEKDCGVGIQTILK